MRPSFDVDGHAMREITLWKAIVFSIITLGVYYYILTYQNTRDIQAAREKPFAQWQLIFWISVIPFMAFLHIVLWVFNFLGFKELREKHGQTDQTMGILALVLAIVVSPVGQIIWAVHFNNTLAALGKPLGTPQVAPSAGQPA